MPLIVICGKPCTGKTRFTEQLVDHLHTKGIKEVEVVNEEILKIKKLHGYQDAANEKSTRGLIKSTVDHKLSNDCYVIVDSLNYIKGFRYELYCSARTYRTSHCVIWIATEDSISEEWNEKQIKETGDGFYKEIMIDLRRRFEAPIETNRWDQPLFKVRVDTPVQKIDEKADNSEINNEKESIEKTENSSEPEKKKTSAWKPKKKKQNKTQTTVQTDQNPINPTTENIEKPLDNVEFQNSVFFSGTRATESSGLTLGDFRPAGEVLEEIFVYLTSAVAPPPNSSTVAQVRGGADLLYELDKKSQEIVQSILMHQQDHVEGTPMKFPEFDRMLTLYRPVGMVELQRHRKQYLKINAKHPPKDGADIGTAFIEFLSNQL